MDPFTRKYLALQRVNKVVSEYRKAARNLRHRYKTKKTTIIEWVVWGSIISGVALEVWAMASQWDSITWAVVVSVLLLLGLFLQRYATFLIYHNVAKDPSFNKLLPDNPLRLYFEIDRHPILVAYLAKELNPTLLTMTVQERKKLSEDFLRYSERSKKKVTFTIAVTGLFYLLFGVHFYKAQLASKQLLSVL